MQEELKQLKNFKKQINTFKLKITKENENLYEEFLEQPLEDVLNEIELKIEDTSERIKEALKEFN